MVIFGEFNSIYFLLMIRIWIWIINVRLGQCSRSGGIVASLIAAIPHCQTQPIELVYFALAESTSTQRSPRQGRKKICWLRWKSLGKHWPKRSFVTTCHTCVTWGFFSDSIQADQQKQTRQLNKSGFCAHCQKKKSCWNFLIFGD